MVTKPHQLKFCLVVMCVSFVTESDLSFSACGKCMVPAGTYMILFKNIASDCLVSWMAK